MQFVSKQFVSKDNGSAVATSAGSAPRRGRRLRLAGGGLVLTFAVLGLGVVFHGNATFAEDYVSSQLSEQRINFAPAEALSPDERMKPCLVRNAGKPLTTGKQAECYANNFIGHHLKRVAGGKTYAEMRPVITTLESQVADAQIRNDPALADLQHRLVAATGQRRTLLEGETVRGMLLTSYGFGSLGEKAGQAAFVANLVAGGLVLASVAVLVAASVGGDRRRSTVAA